MKINFLDLPEPGNRYKFGELFGSGVFGKVFAAVDTQASNKRVAIKLQNYTDDTKEYIEDEYRILRDLSNHLNIIDFYGVYKKKNEIWFVTEVFGLSASFLKLKISICCLQYTRRL